MKAVQLGDLSGDVLTVVAYRIKNLRDHLDDARLASTTKRIQDQVAQEIVPVYLDAVSKTRPFMHQSGMLAIEEGTMCVFIPLHSLSLPINVTHLSLFNSLPQGDRAPERIVARNNSPRTQWNVMA